MQTLSVSVFCGLGRLFARLKVSMYYTLSALSATSTVAPHRALLFFHLNWAIVLPLSEIPLWQISTSHTPPFCHWRKRSRCWVRSCRKATRKSCQDRHQPELWCLSLERILETLSRQMRKWVFLLLHNSAESMISFVSNFTTIFAFRLVVLIFLVMDSLNRLLTLLLIIALLTTVFFFGAIITMTLHPPWVMLKDYYVSLWGWMEFTLFIRVLIPSWRGFIIHVNYMACCKLSCRPQLIY